VNGHRQLSILLNLATGDPDIVVRLTKWAGRAEYDIGLTPIETFAKLVSRVKPVGPLIERAAEAQRLMMTGISDDYALATMLEVMNEWDDLRVTLRSGGSGLTKKEMDDVVQAVDQHLGARAAFTLGTVTNVPSRPTRWLPKTVKQKELPGAKLAQDARAAALKTADTQQAWKKLLEYIDQDDPAWDDLADLVVERAAGKKLTKAQMTKLVDDVQGKLGEHLAMRLRTVALLLEDANRRAQDMVKKLAGEGWRVRFCDGEVRASLEKGGMQQSYDASIWLVREKPLPPLAVPMLLIQVKSGTVREAMEQTASDVARGEFSRLGRPEVEMIKMFNNKGKATKYVFTPRFDGSEPHRLLIAPRLPSERSIVTNLPPGTAVDYVRLPLTQREMRRVAEAIANAGVARVAASKKTKQIAVKP
jgi:hypothetical protein